MAIFFDKIQALRQLIAKIRNTGSLSAFLGKFSYILKSEGVGGIFSRISKIDRNNYRKWIKQFDVISLQSLALTQARQHEFKQKPLISVIMPVYNPNPRWLKQAIESVRTQIYPNWELCIADDASTNEIIRQILTQYEGKDHRIKVVFREKNGHIAACSNSALEIASGDWIALLDHDDLLAPDALFRVAECINLIPEIRLIYSDEDKIDKSGKRTDPYFKSDWNPDLFYAHNMFSHLGVYQTDLVRQAGNFRIGYEGSQDYDLALRCIERVESRQIFHIPKVLYHWRIHKESTAHSTKSKPYAMQAGERSINEHFQRTGIKATAELVGFGYRIRYELPEIPPKVSIIIPTRNEYLILSRCIERILSLTTYPNYEIIVVDNGTDDPLTLRYLEEKKEKEPRFSTLRIDEPFNYSLLNNAGAANATGEFIALLNNDVSVISPNWLEEMMGIATQPGVGAVGAKLYYPDESIQHAGIVIGLGKHGVAGCAHNRIRRANKGYFGRASLSNSFSAVTAACMVVSKPVYEQVNGFDEHNLPVSYNDVDFCLRLKEAGYRNVFTPYAELYHDESYSREKEVEGNETDRYSAEINYFLNRWHSILKNDPAYNPNLTLQYSDFSLAWPPRSSKPKKII